MSALPKPRIVIVDNDSQVGCDLQAMLDPLGYRVAVAKGVGRELIGDARQLALSFRPHVVVVDLRLLDEYHDDRSGLGLLRNLESARSILYSAYLTPEVIREALQQYHADDWISKRESPQLLLDAIARVAKQQCAACRSLSIHLPSAFPAQRIVETLFGSDNGVPPDIVRDIIGLLFSDNQEIMLEPISGEVITSPEASRGHSVVLKAHADDLEPLVVKLAPAEAIQRECDRYDEFVKGRLVGRFHAQLERARTFWELGGAVYSFLGSSVKSLPSFTTFYRQKAAFPVQSLQHFFGEVWSKHYHRPPTGTNVSLWEIYDSTLNLHERLLKYGNQEDKRSFSGVPVLLANPVPWVLRHPDDSLIPGARQAVTHGDLHGDNLFVDTEHAWAVDFERTGIGHILRDFVELEVDVVTRVMRGSEQPDLYQFYQLVTVLAAPATPTASFDAPDELVADREVKTVLDFIARLRALAHTTTHYSDSREYLWGILLDSLFVAMLAEEGSPQRERALLLASVFCERLRCWEKEWPPKHWPPITSNSTIYKAV